MFNNQTALESKWFCGLEVPISVPAIFAPFPYKILYLAFLPRDSKFGGHHRCSPFNIGSLERILEAKVGGEHPVPLEPGALVHGFLRFALTGDS